MLIAIEHDLVTSLVQALEQTRTELVRLQTMKPVESDDPIGVQAAADYLNLSMSAVYQNMTKIPHRKRHGKLYFFKSELRAYLDAGVD